MSQKTSIDRFTIMQGDTADALQVTLTRGDGTPEPLVGATVTFFMEINGRSVISDQAVTVTDADNGVVVYTWQAGDTDECGVFHGFFKVVFADTTVKHFPNRRDADVTLEIEIDAKPS